MSMKVVEINEGPKIDYSVKGAKVTINDDITINLVAREKDWPVHIDICFDEDRELMIGAAGKFAYVAQFDIPARRYEPVAPPTGDMEDMGGDPPVPMPLDMNKVTMTLWSIA